MALVVIAAVLAVPVVIGIIGILAAIAIPNFIRFQARSKQSECHPAAQPPSEAHGGCTHGGDRVQHAHLRGLTRVRDAISGRRARLRGQNQEQAEGSHGQALVLLTLVWVSRTRPPPPTCAANPGTTVALQSNRLITVAAVPRMGALAPLASKRPMVPPQTMSRCSRSWSSTRSPIGAGCQLDWPVERGLEVVVLGAIL